jgi:hypothetical protein
MRIDLSRLATLFAILTVMNSAPSLAQTGEGACFSDWTAAAAVVKANGLVTSQHLTSLAQTQLGGAIVRLALCESDTASGYAYRVIVRTAAGGVKTLVLDAKQPFDR